MASLKRRERMFTRLWVIVGISRRLARKVARSTKRSVEGSRVVAVAERPRLSARLISPTISPAPRTARMTWLPSGWSMWTLTLPSRMM